jgi:hypothetical protein
MNGNDIMMEQSREQNMALEGMTDLAAPIFINNVTCRGGTHDENKGF